MPIEADVSNAETVDVDPRTTAVLVLDLTVASEHPDDPAASILGDVRRLLDRSRAADIPVLYTVSRGLRGTERGVVAPSLGPVDSEPVLYPDGFDKFVDGSLLEQLSARGVRTLIIAGSWANISVMYTATTAVRQHRFDVVIPRDAIAAPTEYELDYAQYQLRRISSLAPGLTGALTIVPSDRIRIEAR